jgi:hypothetical protein
MDVLLDKFLLTLTHFLDEITLDIHHLRDKIATSFSLLVDHFRKFVHRDRPATEVDFFTTR